MSNRTPRFRFYRRRPHATTQGRRSDQRSLDELQTQADGQQQMLEQEDQAGSQERELERFQDQGAEFSEEQMAEMDRADPEKQRQGMERQLKHQARIIQSMTKRLEKERVLTEQLEAEYNRNLKGLQTSYEQTTKLLEARTSELRAAQEFLSKTDTASDADVIQMVGDLNSEIYQTAVTLAEDVILTEKQYGEETETVDLVTGRYGEKFVKMLQSVRHSGDGCEFLQIAFQTSLALFARGVILPWNFDNKDNLSISAMYNSIYTSEEQAVAGRWRSLTRKNIKMPVTEHELVRIIADSLVSMIVCAGLCTKQNGRELHLSKIHNKLESITKSVCQLRKTLGQEITSSDLSIIAPSVGSSFNTNLMENYFTEDSKGREVTQESTLAITDLGLKKRVSTAKTREDANGKSGKQILETVLLKSKVVLETFFYFDKPAMKL